MGLPTTNLKLRIDISTASSVYQTYVSTNNYTNSPPADGATATVMVDADGKDLYLDDAAGGKYRSTTPLMKLACADYAAASSQVSSLYVRTTDAVVPISSLINASSHTLAIAFYPETITSTAAESFNNGMMFGDNGQFFGMFLKDASGTPKLQCYAWDGSEKHIDATVAVNRTWIAIYHHTAGNLKLTVIDDTGTEQNPTDVACGAITTLTNAVKFGKNTGSAFYDGRFGEAVFYDSAVTGTDLTDLKNYFKDKWLSLGGPGFLLVKN